MGYNGVSETSNCDEGSIDRRFAVFVMGLYPLVSSWGPFVNTAHCEEALPSDSKLKEYADPQDGFTIFVPDGWQQGTGNLGETAADSRRSQYSNAAGMQRVVAFYPEAASGNASVAVTIQPLSADFTGLGSFGTALDFGSSLVGSMDQSYLLRRRGILQGGKQEGLTVAKLVDAKEASGNYLITYDVSKGGEPSRRVFTAVAIGTAPNGFRRFFTVNGSCMASDYEMYGGMLQQAVESFRAPNL